MFHVVIPARFAATRLPGKPLLDIGGRPLIQWVWERACASGAASVIVATDDERIQQAVAAFGADCALTAPQHASGTDRIAEVARARGLQRDDIVVNLQGDEPLMPPAVVRDVAAALSERPLVDIATAVAPDSELGGVSRYQLRQGAARPPRPSALFQPCAGSLAARARCGRTADGVRRGVAPHRPLRLSGTQSPAIRLLAADAARDDRAIWNSCAPWNTV